jgi:hypothetical protein
MDIRSQKLDIVADLGRHNAVDSSQCVLRVVELIFLEVNPGKPERGFVAYRFINITLEHFLDRAAGAMVHPVIEFEISDREFRIVDVEVERVE